MNAQISIQTKMIQYVAPQAAIAILMPFFTFTFRLLCHFEGIWFGNVY